MLRLPVLCFLFLCCFQVQQAHAQQEDYFSQPDKNGNEKFFYGALVAGINASQIDGDTYAGFHKAGLNVGLASYIKFNPKWVASLELLFSQKGARNVTVYNSPAIGSVPIMYTAKLNYIEIPVMLNYNVSHRVWLGGGLSYARLFSDKESMDSYTQNSINTQENTFRSQDINYLIALSYQLSHNLFVRARYQYSVLSIRDASKIPVEFGTPAQYNNLFALQFVLLF